MLTGYAASDLVHYFSRETLISLELPLDWAQDDEGDHTAVYVYRPVDETYTDDEDETTPRFTVQLVAVPGAPANTLDRLSTALIDAADQPARVLTSGSLTVDGLPARMIAFEHPGPGGGREARYQVFVQWDEVVFSFAGTCPAGDADTFFPQFEGAVASARVVPIEAR